MTVQPIEELYTNEKYCFQEIHEARRIFGDRKLFTRESARQLSKMLGMMYLYCPEDIQIVVLSTLHEVTMREGYLPLEG